MYGDTAGDNSGYICLLLDGGHFDVLHGVDSVTPAIPRSAEPQGVCGERMAWQAVEIDSSRYSSPFVWKWPSGQMDGVTVADTSYGTERLYSYAAVVKSVSPEPSPKPVTVTTAAAEETSPSIQGLQ